MLEPNAPCSTVSWGVGEDEAFGGDGILAANELVTAGPCLQDRDSPVELISGREVLEQDDVVAHVRDPELRQGGLVEEMVELMGHEDADLKASAALYQ